MGLIREKIYDKYFGKVERFNEHGEAKKVNPNSPGGYVFNSRDEALNKNYSYSDKQNTEKRQGLFGAKRNNLFGN